MTKHVFLIDITRHKGPVRSVVQTVRAHAANFDSSRLIWLHSPAQIIERAEGEEYLSALPETLVEMIVTAVKNRVADGTATTTFSVFSHDGAILREASKLNDSEFRVKTQSLASLRRGESALSRPFTGVSTVISELPVAEAADMTKAILSNGGHRSAETALLQNRLRGLLAKKDPRAIRNARSQASQLLIRNLVQLGIEQGWLGSGKKTEQPGTETLWLIEPTSSAPVIRSEAAKRAHDKTMAIITYLKANVLYAPKDVRDLVLRQLLKITTLEITVAKLFREASKMAQEAAPSQGINFDHWRPAVESITNIAIKSGILLDVKGKVIADSFASRGTLVGKIDSDLVNACDRFLVVATIGGIAGLTTKDAPSIAHALFKEAPSKISQEDMIDRVHEVLSQLSGKLDQDSDGTLVVI